MNEVEHMSTRVKRLEEAILEVVKLAPQPMQDIIRDLQALRGVAHISAVTIASEMVNISSLLQSARKLMGYCGVFPSENSSGSRVRRGGITKAGNAHPDASWWNRPGAIDTWLASGKSCASDTKVFRQQSSRSHGSRRIACISAR
jgi:transposase